MLIIAKSETLLKDHIQGITYLIENLGFVINFPKSLLQPKKIIVPGLSGGLQCHGAETAWGQTEKHSRRSEEDSDFRIYHSTGAVENTGENECHNQSTRDSPLVLQAIASGAAISFKQIPARLQYHGERSHPGPMIRNSRNGLAGVVRWVSIPLLAPIGEVVNCLADLLTQGYQYRSLNAFRSSIFSVHNKVNGCDVGQHPLVTRLLKGASKTTSATVHSDMGRGIGHRLHIKINRKVKIKVFHSKIRPSRSADLAKLSLDRRSYSTEGVIFIPKELAKQSRQQKHGTEFYFTCYPEDERLCPVLALRAYKAHTAPTRVTFHVIS